MGQHGNKYAVMWTDERGELKGSMTYNNLDNAQDGQVRFGKYYRTFLRNLGTGQVMANPVNAIVLRAC